MRDHSSFTRGRVLYWILLLCFFACGCSTTVNDGREWVRPVYREEIRDWQTRIQREGWSENGVHSVLVRFRELASYKVDLPDHWDTPTEFVNKGFSGDCKNIAIFEMAVLKQLGYPYGIKILIVHALFEDHALLRVEMPEGGWKVYDVVSEAVPSPKMELLKPVAEFDEKQVVWFSPKSGVAQEERRPHSIAVRSADQKSP